MWEALPKNKPKNWWKHRYTKTFLERNWLIWPFLFGVGLHCLEEGGGGGLIITFANLCTFGFLHSWAQDMAFPGLVTGKQLGWQLLQLCKVKEKGKPGWVMGGPLLSCWVARAAQRYCLEQLRTWSCQTGFPQQFLFHLLHPNQVS